MPPNNSTLATKAVDAAARRSIPKNRTALVVGAAVASASLADYAGKFIYLEAVTLPVTVRLGSAQVALTNGQGFVIVVSTDTDKKYQEFFVDPADPDQTLSHIASGAATLVIHHD